MQEKKVLGDGVITGFGEINGQKVCIYSQDFKIFGGSVSKNHGAKICKIMDIAESNRIPIIGILDSGGGRIQEGVHPLSIYSQIFYKNVKLSGVVPQISLLLGPCAGGAAYSPAITDFILMAESISKMFISGPTVIKSAIGESVNPHSFGDANLHDKTTGISHFMGKTEKAVIEFARDLISYLPANNSNTAPLKPCLYDNNADELDNIIPSDRKRPYKMHKIFNCVFDTNSFLEIQKNYAKNIIIGFARLNGFSVGVVANNPEVMAGCIEINASLKAARFVRFCDSFNIPIITFVDTPGFLPGSQQEKNGLIRHGAKLLYAFCEATSARMSVITRKAYGGGYAVMNPKQTGCDYSVAWPCAELAVMGAEAACDSIFRKEIRSAHNPTQYRKQVIADYEDKYLNPYVAASHGYIDDIIKPSETRAKLIRALSMLRTKEKKPIKRKHGNIPL